METKPSDQYPVNLTFAAGEHYHLSRNSPSPTTHPKYKCFPPTSPSCPNHRAPHPYIPHMGDGRFSYDVYDLPAHPNILKYQIKDMPLDLIYDISYK